MDPIDSLSIYAYIAKAQANETFLEDKCKIQKEAPKTLRRNMYANIRNDGECVQKSMPST